MRSVVTFGVILVLFLTVGIGIAGADKPTIIESYQGNAMVMSGGGSSIATINIYRWSSDEERDEILQAIKYATDNPTKADREVAKALRGQKKVGYAFFAGRQGHPLRYARKFDQGDDTVIILATDRPVTFREAYQDSQMGDFDVSLILIGVDKEGKGQAVLSVGTEVLWSDKTDELEVKNMSSQPIKIEGLRRTH